MLIRWTTKPQGTDRFSALACASPVMSNHAGSYGTRVFNGTKGRPKGRGGGAD